MPHWRIQEGVRLPPSLRRKKKRKKKGGEKKRGKEWTEEGRRKLILGNYLSRNWLIMHISCFRISKNFWRELLLHPICLKCMGLSIRCPVSRLNELLIHFWYNVLIHRKCSCSLQEHFLFVKNHSESQTTYLRITQFLRRAKELSTSLNFEVRGGLEVEE